MLYSGDFNLLINEDVDADDEDYKVLP